MNNNQHNWNYPAPHGKRLVAFFIDSVISQVALSLIAGVLQVQLPAFLNGIFASLYFAILHSQMGWTPGKKLMGLEIISTHTNEKPKLGQALLREWFGRFLNLLTLGIGYLMIFFNESHEGLHDRVCKTQVVTDQPSESTSAATVLLGSVGALSALIGFGVYALFYTDIPLKHYAKMMEAQGVRIDGIKGNLATGFTLGSLSYATDGVDVAAENLAFTYQDIFKMYSKHEIRIQNIGVSKLDLKLSARKNTTEQWTEKKDKPESKKESTPAGDRTPLKFVIERVDVNQVKVSYEGKEITQIQRFFLSEATIAAGEGSIDRVWLDSKQALIDVKNIKASLKGINLENSSLVLKKDLKPDLLQGDVDLQLSKGHFDFATKSYDVEIEGLHRSLKGKISNERLEIAATNLQPHWYFKNFPPAHSFNLQTKAAGVMELIIAPHIQGSYVIGGQVFNVVPPVRMGEFLPAIATCHGKKIQARFVYKGLTESPLKIALESPEIPDMDGLLSEVYFSKQKSTLSPAELMSLDKDRAHFDLAQAAVLPLGLPLPQMMAPSARIPAQTAPAAMPISQPRIPTMLPAK